MEAKSLEFKQTALEARRRRRICFLSGIIKAIKGSRYRLCRMRHFHLIEININPRAYSNLITDTSTQTLSLRVCKATPTRATLSPYHIVLLLLRGLNFRLGDSLPFLLSFFSGTTTLFRWCVRAVYVTSVPDEFIYHLTNYNL